MSLLGKDWDDPRTMATFQMAAGLLGGGNFGQAASRGLAAYQDTMSQAEKAAALREDRDYLKQEREAKAMQEQRRREWLAQNNPAAMAMQNGQGPTAGNATNLNPAQQQKWGMANAGVLGLDDYAKSLLPKEPEEYTLGEGQARFRGDKVIAQRESKVDPNKPFLMMDGKIVPNPAFQQFELEKASRGASRQTTNVNTGGNAFWKGFGDSASNKAWEDRKAAELASSNLASLGEIRSAWEAGTYQGAGADLKLGAAKALQALGMPYDAKAVANSEVFAAQANNFVLSSVKALGANPSNTDLAFIQKTVPTLSTDPAALPRLLDFMEQKSRGQIQKWNQTAKTIQSDPSSQQIPFQLEIPEPAARSAAQALPELPKANSSNKGRVIEDTTTGQRLRSNGMSWVPEK